jgi:Cu+-exporting ATPase
MGFDIFMLGATIVAAGALTWFVIWYFFSPADTDASQAATDGSAESNKTPRANSSDEAYAELYGDRPHEVAKLTKLLAVGIALTAIVFFLGVLSFFGTDNADSWLHADWIQSPWLQAILITPVMFYCGRPIHHIGLHAIANRSPDIHSLISIGTWAAYIYSLAVCIASNLMPEGSREPYFESVGVTITLILLGRLMETKSRALSDSSVQQLAKLLPETAHLLSRQASNDGELLDAAELSSANETAHASETTPVTQAAQATQEVSSSTLGSGDLVVVNAGEALPADGTVFGADASVNESIITGDAERRLKQAGDKVFAGTTVVSGTLILRCTKVGKQSVLGNIVNVASHAQDSEAPVQRLTDRISRIVVPVVMLIAIWTFAIWIVIGPQPRLSHAVVTAINVLIIACPCALALVTPLSVGASVNLGASNGIVLASAKVLQQGTHIRTLIVDQAVISDSQDKDAAHSAALAMQTLRDDDVRTVLLGSSDTESAIEQARSLGIEEVIAAVDQRDKVAWVKRLIEESSPGDLVALASDGVENAAALGAADVGFAVGSGIDGMLQSADITVVNGDLGGIPKAIQLCDITVRNIRENFIWAMAFNIASIPIAVGVLYPFTGWLLNPVIAAVAMALSSLCVVLNAHRLRHQVIRITTRASDSSTTRHEPHLISRQARPAAEL